MQSHRAIPVPLTISSLQARLGLVEDPPWGAQPGPRVAGAIGGVPVSQFFPLLAA